MKDILKTGVSSLWSHKESYKSLGIAAITHRSRLLGIICLIDDMKVVNRGKLADFGCSDGYIISLLQREVFLNKDWKFYGFDHSENLLSEARARNLPNAEFHFFQLNVFKSDRSNSFDIVTCFDTLEHTGNYKNAFVNLYSFCRTGGSIVVTIPDERGIPGLLEYVGRKTLRRNAYGNFYDGKSELKYVWSLILNRPIDVFRYPSAEGWGPHLGFDYKPFEDFLQEKFLKKRKLEITYQGNPTLNFSRLYLFRKLRKMDAAYLFPQLVVAPRNSAGRLLYA